MPRALLWTPLANGFSRKDVNTLLETIKASKITKSELNAVHGVRRHSAAQYALPASAVQLSSLRRGTPYAKCQWRAKTLRCELAVLANVLMTGEHVTGMRSAPLPRLTQEMKVFAQEMAAQGLKPVRIRNAILCKFNLAPKELPSLSKIQRSCQLYAITKLSSNDYVKETRELIRDAGYVSSMDEHESFTFTLGTDADGLLAVGNGSDAKPFIVWVTSRRLLMQANHDSGSTVDSSKSMLAAFTWLTR